jgi:CRISPR-associated protein (TIGR03986 family)
MTEKELPKGIIHVEETKKKKIIAEISFTDDKGKIKSLGVMGNLEKKHLEYNGKEVLFLSESGRVTKVLLAENNVSIFAYTPVASVAKKNAGPFERPFEQAGGNFGGPQGVRWQNGEATAPYNFVPLPEKVFFPDYQVEHDRPVGGLDGEIELEIEGLTPMFIRDGQKLADYSRDNGNGDSPDRVNPGFFCDADNKPMIPGSSLRGMVRNLVEILSYSKMTQVTNEHLFYRSVGNDKVGQHYCSQFVKNSGNISSGFSWHDNTPISVRAPLYDVRVRSGFVRKKGSVFHIEECDFARVDHGKIKSAFGKNVVHDKDGVPDSSLHKKDVFVNVDPHKKHYFFSYRERGHGNMYLHMRKVHEISDVATASASVQGKLIITGNMPTVKHIEFVFFPQVNPKEFKIPEEKLKRFNDDDQITQWQQKAYSAEKGKLCDGDAVFFLTDASGTIDFFGRAQLFRLPYDLSPFDLASENLHNDKHDLSELLFGIIPTDKPEMAVKGRVRFGDARVVNVNSVAECYEKEGKVITPHILGSPKPTCIAHYLEQKDVPNKSCLFSYLSEDKGNTKIRGHKLYWHRWDEKREVEQVIDFQAKADSTQHTKMKVLKKGLKFKAIIRFENLYPIELGALLSALSLPEGCAHKIGMGKSLGLGSIKIKPELRVYEHGERYGSFVENGVVEKKSDDYLKVFQETIINHIKANGGSVQKGSCSLKDIARLQHLYKMLNWERRPTREKTEHMFLNTREAQKKGANPSSTFRDKFILPEATSVK